MKDYSLEEIQQAIAELVQMGLLYDTGERQISRKTGREMIVWATVPTTENVKKRVTVPGSGSAYTGTGLDN